MFLYRLIYCSRARKLDEGAIREILESCERNNPRQNLTGMLLFTSDYFVQFLEGSRDSVNRAFLEKIARDPRHSDVQIMTAGTVDHRVFERWSMHYIASLRSSDPALRRFSMDSAFNPYQMSSAAIEQFCISWSVRLLGDGDYGDRMTAH